MWATLTKATWSEVIYRPVWYQVVSWPKFSIWSKSVLDVVRAGHLGDQKGGTSWGLCGGSCSLVSCSVKWFFLLILNLFSLFRIYTIHSLCHTKVVTLSLPRLGATVLGQPRYLHQLYLVSVKVIQSFFMVHRSFQTSKLRIFGIMPNIKWNLLNQGREKCQVQVSFRWNWESL